MLLYVIYNADLLELTENPGEDSLGYVDDALVMAKGDDLEETVEILTDFMTREEGGFAWAEAHNSTCTIDKLAVTHFTRRRMADLGRPGCTIIREAPAVRGHNFRPSSLEYSRIMTPNIFHHCETPYVPPHRRRSHNPSPEHS